MNEFKREQYKDKAQLLNGREQELYSKLREAAPNYQIHTQVSMSQLFNITGKNGFMQVGEIGRKSVDFLLCREDTSIVLAIELNGPTHEKAKQKAGDEKKRISLEEAGIPLVIIKPEAIPSVENLRKILAPYVVERTKHEASKNEDIQPKPNTHITNQLQVAEQSPEYKASIINSCKYCKSTNLEINHGKFGYHFRCLECNKNTGIKMLCPTCNRSEKIRKAKEDFFTECAHCSTSRPFHSNA